MPLCFPVHLQTGFTGTVNAIAIVESTGDFAYNGISDSFTVEVEDNTVKEILITASTTEAEEGTTLTYQVALSTSPNSDVTVSLELAWGAGLVRDPGTASPATLVFPAGVGTTFQTVTIRIPYSESFMGDGTFVVTHTASSDDPYYDAASSVGAPSVTSQFFVNELGGPGVCLRSCLKVSKYDFLFDSSSSAGSAVDTPYEVASGEVSLAGCMPLLQISNTKTMEFACLLHCGYGEVWSDMVKYGRIW